MKRWRRTGAMMLGVLALLCASFPLHTERVARGYWRLDPAALQPLADQVAAAVEGGVDPSWFSTGDARFDGEWALVTCQMAVIGLGQLALRAPETRARYQPALEGCARWLITPEARQFGTEGWGEDGLSPEALQSDRGHAYLGWTNVALALAARLVDDPEVRDTHTRLTEALARRMATLPVHELQTYPGESYPADQVMVAASVALAGGHEALLSQWSTSFRQASLDPSSGLLYQSLSPRDGHPTDSPRGSGSALSAAFLQYVDPVLARELARQVQRQLGVTTLGFGAVREVPRGASLRMDIDSGPVIFGRGVSATGFSIAAARVAGDERWFRSLVRTAHTVGGPRPGRGRWYLTGGSLGNAILLAMFTVGPVPE
jgi:hypothetical protein